MGELSVVGYLFSVSQDMAMSKHDLISCWTQYIILNAIYEYFV